MSLPKSLVIYCNEDVSLIENYYKALNSPEDYDVHHRLELDTGTYISSDELIKRGLYYDRPAKELILLPHGEHTKIHASFGFPNKSKRISEKRKGHIVTQETRDKIRQSRLLHNSLLTEEEWKKEYACSEETRRKISEKNKGRIPPKMSDESKQKHREALIKMWQNPEYKARVSKKVSEGVKRTYTEEHKRITSEFNKGRKHSEKMKEKCRQNMLGKKWWNNGKESILCRECPEGYKAGRIINWSFKDNKTVGYHWYTDGSNSVYARECPEGWRKGRPHSTMSDETKRKMSIAQLRRYGKEV